VTPTPPPVLSQPQLPRPLARARTTGNPIVAVNYADPEIRKALAEHRRKTACFARSAAMSMARLWVGAEHTPFREDRVNRRLTPRYCVM
jgi:hypothetical protein